jgi:hypothetical protein
MHNIFIYSIITLLYIIIENLMWYFIIYLIKSLIKNSATNYTLFNINIRYLTLLILYILGASHRVYQSARAPLNTDR